MKGAVGLIVLDLACTIVVGSRSVWTPAIALRDAANQTCYSCY